MRISSRTLTRASLVSCLVASCGSYRLRLDGPRESTAPEALCFSGALDVDGDGAGRACPTTVEEARNRDAVAMDADGRVTVRLRDVRLRDDHRRRARAPRDGRDGWSHYRDDRALSNATTHDDDDPPHHVQIYLVAVDEEYVEHVAEHRCCYERELSLVNANNDNSSSVAVTLPPECGRGGRVHDYRIGAPRSPPLGHASVPLTLAGRDGAVDVVARLRPATRGRHVVVVSNCAADTYFDERGVLRARPLKIVAEGGVEVDVVGRRGALPSAMAGIVPFYGAAALAYAALTATWLSRGRRAGAPTLGPQRAARALVVCQTVFSFTAFLYYRRLDRSPDVDAATLRSGAAAALVDRGPWSAAMATARLGTLLACQSFVTLATDGVWLVRREPSSAAKLILVAGALCWTALLLSYGRTTERRRRLLCALGGAAWAASSCLNVRRSLRHLRSLVVGDGTDRVSAVGGAIVAKRSLFRRMFVYVAAYPLVFCASFVWTTRSTQDSWAWVGYVLIDVYLFVFLTHLSIVCMPRPMSSQEYVKYAPLEADNTNDNDNDMWNDMDSVAEVEEYENEDSFFATLGSKLEDKEH